MHIEDWSITKVRPYPNNPRVLRNAAEKVAESIKAFGWRQPIVVDADGVIIAGHGRHAAAEICTRLGMEDEELDRLLDRSGMTVLGTAGTNGFGRAWVPGREG